MGNRAVLTFGTKARDPAIYLHWNGGRASVEGFLAAARALDITGESDAERMDNVAALIAQYLETHVGFTIYREPFGRTDQDNGDNGVYLLNRNWTIRGRLFDRGEEINPAKTESIARDCVALGALL